MEDPSKVLVTGGAGFIGSHLVDRLMRMGNFVRIVDNFSSGNLNNVRSWLGDDRFDLFRGDLKDPDIAKKSVEGVKTVFHLAANPEVRIAETDPSIHFNENLLVTFNILEAMRESNGAKQIVFLSSSTIYGEPDEFPTSEKYGFSLPISVYGASKLGCESLISSYCYTFDLRGIILRCANIVGERMTHGVIVDFVRKLQKNSIKLEILGDGTQNKSYLYIKDFVDGVILAYGSFLNEGEAVDVYNIGSFDQLNVKRIAEIVVGEMGLQDVEFRLTGGVDGGRGWRGDVKEMLLSSEKLSGLGWKPALNSEDAVRESCSELLHSMKGDDRVSKSLPIVREV